MLSILAGSSGGTGRLRGKRSALRPCRALTGLSPLLEIGVYTREQVVVAIDRHLDELFAS